MSLKINPHFYLNLYANNHFAVRVSIFLCLVLFYHLSLAQLNQIGFQNYNTSNGMSRNRITCMEQDKQGYIWLGPQANGLMRFDGYRFKVFKNNPKDSTSILHEDILQLHCDKQNDIWMATPNGAQVYQSSTGHFYAPSKLYGTPSVLNNITVNAISEDASGRLWFITANNGLFSLDVTNKKSQQYFRNDILANKLVTCVQDAKHDLWVLAQLCLLHINKEGKINKIPFADTTLFNSFSVNNQEIAIDANGQVWLELSDGSAGLFKISDNATLIKRLYPGGPGSKLPNNRIISLLVDRQNRLWAGTFGGGLYVYNKTKKDLIIFQHNDGNPQSLPGNFVKTIFEDRQGIIWVGTYGSGIGKYDPASHQFETVRKQYDNLNSLTGNDITAAWTPDGHDIFIASRGNGFSRWNRKTNVFTNYMSPPKRLPNALPNNFVYNFNKDSLGNIWVCTHNGLCLLNKDAPPEKAFTVFPPLKKKGYEILFFSIPIFDKYHLLVSSVGGLCIFNIATKQWETLPDAANLQELNPHIATRSIAQDRNRYWISYDIPAKKIPFVCYDADKKELRPIPLTYGNISKLDVKGIASDSNGTHLWLATHQGLAYFNKITAKIEKFYRTENGLADNLCVSVVAYQKDEIWIGTNHGLCKLVPSTNQFTNYDKDYGLQSNEFNNTMAYKIGKAELLFGGINGVDIFKPAQLSKSNFSPIVTITGIKLIGNAETMYVNTETGVQLQPQQNFFTIEFSALNFSHTELTTYQYLLKGIDKNWVNAGTENFATYTNLAPGNYIFNVKATNGDGISTKQITQFLIYIAPAWYQTWWWILFVALMLGGMILGFAKWRINTIKKQGWQKTEIEKLSAEQYKSQLEIATAKQQLKSAQLDALRSQMDPHFIFNSLNSIENFILKNERILASEYLGKFSKLIRNILDNSKNETVPIGQEIETLKIYIELERLRMNNMFDVNYEIEDGLQESDIEIPPMLMQPYVENAILHGIRYRSDGKGLLLVEMFVSAKQSLHYIVQDNGIGRTKAAIENKHKKNSHQPYGTAITQSRIDIYNQLKSTHVTVSTTDINTATGQPAGTKVELIIPL